MTLFIQAGLIIVKMPLLMTHSMLISPAWTYTKNTAEVFNDFIPTNR